MGSLAACVGAPQKDPKNAKNLAFPPKLLFFTLSPGRRESQMSLCPEVWGSLWQALNMEIEESLDGWVFVVPTD